MRATGPEQHKKKENVLSAPTGWIWGQGLVAPLNSQDQHLGKLQRQPFWRLWELVLLSLKEECNSSLKSEKRKHSILVSKSDSPPRVEGGRFLFPWCGQNHRPAKDQARLRRTGVNPTECWRQNLGFSVKKWPPPPSFRKVIFRRSVPPFRDMFKQVGHWNERKACRLVPSPEMVISARSSTPSLTGHPLEGKQERCPLLIEPSSLKVLNDHAFPQRGRRPCPKPSPPDLNARPPPQGPGSYPASQNSADVWWEPLEISDPGGQNVTRIRCTAADAVAAAGCGGYARVRWLLFCGHCSYHSRGSCMVTWLLQCWLSQSLWSLWLSCAWGHCPWGRCGRVVAAGILAPPAPQSEEEAGCWGEVPSWPISSQTVLIAWGAMSKQTAAGDGGGRHEDTHRPQQSPEQRAWPDTHLLDLGASGHEARRVGSGHQWARPGHLPPHLHPLLLHGPPECIRARRRPQFPWHGRQRLWVPGIQDRILYLPQGTWVLCHLSASNQK